MRTCAIVLEERNLHERLQEELQFAKFDPSAAADTLGAGRKRSRCRLPQFDRYLECPLQGAARYSLGMLEDEDAPEEAEDEPIEQSRLNRAVMLRNVFWRIGGKLDALDRRVRTRSPHRADPWECPRRTVREGR